MNVRLHGDSVAIDLLERLDFVEESRDGRLETWYG